MVTLKDISEKSGYSLATVSRVINNNRPVQPEIREHVLQVARQLNYVPNTAARNLAKRRTDSIGVVVNNLHDPFFHDLILGFESAAAETAYNVVFCSAMGREQEQKQRYIRYLSNGVVDGLVLYGSYQFDEALVRELHATGFPLFMIESTVRDIEANALLINNKEGQYSAMRYLHRQGHRKIAYIAAPQDKQVAVDRLEGYLAGARDLQLPLAEEWLQYGHGKDARACTEALLALPGESRPTAILCYDDAAASYVIRTALAKGIRVPEDLSVMGFDNQTIPPDGYTGPPITTVAQPLFEIGFDSIILLSKLLAGELEAPITKTYATSICEKQTVAHPKRE